MSADATATAAFAPFWGILSLPLHSSLETIILAIQAPGEMAVITWTSAQMSESAAATGPSSIAWYGKLIENLPEIISRLSGNTNGLIAVVWLIGAVLLIKFVKDAPAWLRALLFAFAFGGVIYLLDIIARTNTKIEREEAVQSGWTFYQVTTRGTLGSPDGRLYVVSGRGRQYGDLQPGDTLKAADADGAKLYSEPGKNDDRLIGLTDGYSCLKILEAGQPRAVKNPPGSGGWFKVRVIRCGGAP